MPIPNPPPTNVNPSVRPLTGPPVLPTQPVTGGQIPNLPVPLGPPPPVQMYDVKLKRCIESGKLKVKNIPQEDFLLDPNAIKVHENDGRFYADIVRMTRSEAKLKW